MKMKALTYIPCYHLYADDVELHRYARPPTQQQVDDASREASARGWNGTVLELLAPDGSSADVYPSESALSES